MSVLTNFGISYLLASLEISPTWFYCLLLAIVTFNFYTLYFICLYEGSPRDCSVPAHHLFIYMLIINKYVMNLWNETIKTVLYGSTDAAVSGPWKIKLCFLVPLCSWKLFRSILILYFVLKIAFLQLQSNFYGETLKFGSHGVWMRVSNDEIREK